MFDLENAVKDWKRELRRFESFEDGAVLELESHLRDEFDRQTKLGLSADEAFARAAAAVGRPEAVGEEYLKDSARWLAGAPSWTASRPSPALLVNYVKIALRRFKRQKGYSFLNIAGLAIGLACCLLGALFVKDELSYDSYHENADRIHRVAVYLKMGGRESRFVTAPAPLAAALLREFPEVEAAARLRLYVIPTVRFGDQGFRETRFVFADASLFDVFSVPLVAGDPKTALLGPRTVILSESTARRYFGSDQPVGKILRVNTTDDYRVSGVFRDMPSASHFHFDLIASLSSLEEAGDLRWLNNNFHTYVLLRKGADPAALGAKFPGLVKKYFGPEVKAFTDLPLDSLFASGQFMLQYSLQPLRRIHLTSKTITEIEPNGDAETVWIFAAIALFVLLIAGLNFVNLSTARASGRAREAGLRKVLGSERRQLARQFMMESLLMSAAAMGLALVLTGLSLPALNNLAGKNISLARTGGWPAAAFVAAAVLLTGLLAGAYPAFLISAARPAVVLKGPLAVGVRSGRLRQILVVLQFAISIALIAGTAVVGKQLRFIQAKDLGFVKEQVLVIDNAELLGPRAGAFKEEMLKHPRIQSASSSEFLPVPSARNTTTVYPKGQIVDTRTAPMQFWRVDHDYIKTLGLRIAAGRGFSKDFSADGSAAVINRAAARQFGWSDAVGNDLSVPDGRKTADYRVIGVVEDFHFDSLKSEIGPLVMVLGDSSGSIVFRFQGKRASDVVDLLRATWNRFAPGQPLTYSFLDERFAAIYRSERRLGALFGILSGLAIFVACLGLVGLASFLAEQRTKEIGVRKVLGASASEVVLLLGREFVKGVVAANVVAWPVAYFVMRRWLEGFAYRTNLGLGVFLVAGGAALVLAMLTVGLQTVRAALANPVESLRYE